MGIKVAIYGYGKLGKGVECAVKQNGDMELFGIFTRRDPAAVAPLGKDVKVYKADEIMNFKNDIDVVIICGGSATDLPEMTPMLAEHFNVIDSFDTHANIPQHFANTDAAASRGGKTAIISVGWDPGMFSLNRAYANAILPVGHDYTFWGEGVSQGHSDAIRRIEGVADARQYTIPVPAALERVRSGENPELTTREKHTRRCFVVLKDGADADKVREEIVTMPNYFDEYDTEVNFITAEEMARDHSNLPHGGFVIRTGTTGFDNEHNHVIEYSLKLDSNPEFTASVLAAYARAAVRMNKKGDTGCKTVFDVAPAELMNITPEEMRAHML